MPSDQVQNDAVDELLCDEPELAQVIHQVLRKMRHGFFTQCYVDAIVQKPARSSYDIHDAFYFAEVHGALLTGRIVHAIVEVGSEPMPDKMARQNNQALSHLPHPFSAEFWGGRGDADGRLSWSEPIELAQTLSDGKHLCVTAKPHPPAPLEVGTTKGSTTIWHLKHERALARWPYGSERIYLFKNIDLTLFSPPDIDLLFRER